MLISWNADPFEIQVTSSGDAEPFLVTFDCKHSHPLTHHHKYPRISLENAAKPNFFLNVASHWILQDHGSVSQILEDMFLDFPFAWTQPNQSLLVDILLIPNLERDNWLPSRYLFFLYLIVGWFHVSSRFRGMLHSPKLLSTKMWALIEPAWGDHGLLELRCCCNQLLLLFSTFAVRCSSINMVIIIKLNYYKSPIIQTIAHLVKARTTQQFWRCSLSITKPTCST